MLIDAPAPEQPRLAIITLDEQAAVHAHRVAAIARRAGVSALRIDSGNPKKRMQRAVNSGAQFAAFVDGGPTIGLKNLHTQEQQQIALDSLVEALLA